MKRTISLLSVLAFVLAFSGSAFAQSVTASAQIVNSINVQNTQGLSFGQLAGDFGSTVEIAADGTETNTGSGGTKQVGYAEIVAAPNVDILVTATAPSSLDNTNSSISESIPFTGLFVGDQDNDVSTAADNTTLSTDGSSDQVTTNDNGSGGPHYYLHLGGQLTSNDGGTTAYAGGTYEGTITINVSYL